MVAGGEVGWVSNVLRVASPFVQVATTRSPECFFNSKEDK